MNLSEHQAKKSPRHQTLGCWSIPNRKQRFSPDLQVKNAQLVNFASYGVVKKQPQTQGCSKLNLLLRLISLVKKLLPNIVSSFYQYPCTGTGTAIAIISTIRSNNYKLS